MQANNSWLKIVIFDLIINYKLKISQFRKLMPDFALRHSHHILIVFNIDKKTEFMMR